MGVARDTSCLYASAQKTPLKYGDFMSELTQGLYELLKTAELRDALESLGEHAQLALVIPVGRI